MPFELQDYEIGEASVGHRALKPFRKDVLVLSVADDQNPAYPRACPRRTQIPQSSDRR